MKNEIALSVSVILPCYNPCPDWRQTLTARIGELQSQLPHLSIQYIVSDDGSTCIDRTDIDALSTQPNVLFIDNVINEGKGAAIRKGCLHATGDIIIYTDIDFPFGVQPIVEMVKIFSIKSDCLFVYGNRTRSYFKRLPLKRKLFSRSLHLLNWILIDKHTIDTQAGIKGLRRELLPELLRTRTNGFVFEVEFLRSVIRKGISLEKIDVSANASIDFSDFSMKVLLREALSFGRIMLRKPATERFVMLTFDLEEFDIPEEYGQKVSKEDQMLVTLKGAERVCDLLEKHAIPTTFFTTGHFAQKNPKLVRRLSNQHEIASHALFHAPTHTFQDSDLIESRSILERTSGQKVHGFRMPRLRPIDRNILYQSGFRYDSSINPTWLPGRYNLLHENANPNLSGQLIELPCSTTPCFRFPLFWLSFKNLPLWLYCWLVNFTSSRRGNLVLYFHPWEFADLDSFKLPAYIRKPDGEELTKKLDRLIVHLKKQKMAFVTCQTFCDHLTKPDLK